MAEIRLPNINGRTEQEQLTQVKDYLFQLTGQLNYALNQVNDEIVQTQKIVNQVSSNGSSEEEQKKKEQQFIELKNLIIKSADMVTFCEDIVTEKLEGDYQASSELFGTYMSKTDALEVKTSTNETIFYNAVDSINSKIDDLSIMRKDNCYIKTGWIGVDENGNRIAGFEVGQYEETKYEDEDGKEIIEYTDRGFAQFRPDKLAFYDKDGTELAYFAQYVMHINKAEIKQTLKLGGYLVDLTDGVAFKWVEKQNETTSFAKKRGED